VPSRRYAPALLVGSVLLLLVAIAPSRGAITSGAGGFAPFDPTAGPGSTTTAAPGVTTAATQAPSTAQPGAASGEGPDAVTPTTGPPIGGSAGTTAGAAVPGAAAGDTRHCSRGLQFALAGFIAAPPCQPRFGGGDNGGATYAGVTRTQITILYYRVKDNPAVTAALGSTGVLPSTAQLEDFLAAEERFINSHYELWGRKVRLVQYQSPSCAGSPPSDDCFRQDARAVVSQFHPFAVVFPQNGTTPGFHDELSKAGVVNFGGLGLPSSFNTSRRPFRYDYTMDGDTQAVLAGELYCKQLANQKARYAGDAALRSKPRKAEILVPDSEGTVATAQHLQSLINACDHGGGATIKTYSQDTSQAASQSTTLASQAKQSGITTLLYFTDPILPIFFTPQLTAQDYHPENIPVGSNFLDFDAIAGLYDQGQWANAFGLGNLSESQPVTKQDAYAAYVSGGGKQKLYLSADGAQGFYSVLASGIQQAGARLDPGTFEHGTLTLPVYGGDRLHLLVQFGAGDYTAQSDVRMTYWSTTTTSPSTGNKGSYLPLDGGLRHGVGTFPSQPLVLPGRG
jgi:hypothetical protein